MNPELNPEFEPGSGGGVVRLNKRPLMLIGGALLLSAFGIGYAAISRGATPTLHQFSGFDPLPETGAVDIATLIGAPILPDGRGQDLALTAITLPEPDPLEDPVGGAAFDAPPVIDEPAPLPHDDEIAVLRAALADLQAAQAATPPAPPVRTPVIMGAPPAQTARVPSPAEIAAAEAEARRQAAIEAARQARLAEKQARIERFDRARTASSRVEFGVTRRQGSAIGPLIPDGAAIQPDLSTLLAGAPETLQAQLVAAQGDARIANADAGAAGELIQALLRQDGAPGSQAITGIPRANAAAPTAFPTGSTPFDAVRSAANPQTLERPASPNLLRSGALIPATMISGIRSDLPGPVIAQVSADVYDTATGRRLLIPQGAKLIGTYDANVRFGQKRVFLVWTRIVFPDASALDLTDAQGVDAGGYAGFQDQVNNHYVRTFGSAILLSAIGAGAQLSQPAPVAGETISPLQIGAAELGRTLAETGRETLRRNLDIAPTLTIRPGYRFNVFVQRDIRFDRPWR